MKTESKKPAAQRTRFHVQSKRLTDSPLCWADVPKHVFYSQLSFAQRTAEMLADDDRRSEYRVIDNHGNVVWDR